MSVVRSTREQLLTPTSPWARLLVLLGLSGFAVSQPVLSVLGDEPSVFVFHDVSGLRLLVFVLAVALVPPLVLWAVGLAVGRVHRTTGWIFHLVCCGALVALATVQVLKYGLDVGSGAVLVSVALAIGIGFAFAYARWQIVATWAQFTAILPVLAVVLFFVASASGELLRPGDASVAQREADVPSVVFVLLDELPTKSLLAEDGGLDAARYPNLATFAEEATWYRNHTTISPSTTSAVPALLTGIDPGFPPGPPLWTQHPDNLFSFLAPTHELNVHESPTELCGVEGCDAARGDPDLAGLLDDTTDLWRQRVTPTADDPLTRDDFREELEPRGDAQAVNEAWLETELEIGGETPARLSTFLETLEPRGRPTLDFIHLLLPHTPFEFSAAGEQYHVTQLEPLSPHATENDEGAWIAALTEYRHLLQAEYTDVLVGRVLDALRENGRYDDSLVVIAADHGASFEPNTPFREARPTSVDSVAFSPLLVKAPGQHDGVVDDSNVLSIDVVPLIARILDIPIPWDVDGVPPGERPAGKYIHDWRDFDREDAGVIEFEAAEAFPDAADRWIGDRPADGDELTLLLERAGIDRYVGTTVDELDPVAGGSATVAGLQDLTDPGDDVPLGVGTGSLESGDEDGLVLVAVDGTVATGSPLFTFKGRPGSFVFFMPPELLGPRNEITFLRVVGGEVRELAVS